MPTTTLMAPSSWLLDPRGSPPPHGSRSLISDLRSLAVGSQSPLADMERGPATTLIGPLPPGRAPVSPLESPHSGLLQLSISGRGSDWKASMHARAEFTVASASELARGGLSLARPASDDQSVGSLV